MTPPRGAVLSGLLAVLVCYGAAACTATVQGTAVRIFDGDSFILETPDGKRIEVRLGEIDAPEKHQPYAAQARKALSELILGQVLKLRIIDVDRYGRQVARVYRLEDELDVNATLVENGHAWVYRRWVREQALYQLERDAREHRRGLWALPEAERTPPWRWRREHPRDAQAPTNCIATIWGCV